MNFLSRFFAPKVAYAQPVLESDILWDRIVSIEYCGYEHVYDIEVEGTHNFIGNGIFAHNTYVQRQEVRTAVPAFVTVQFSEEPRRRAGLNLPYDLGGAILKAELLPAFLPPYRAKGLIEVLKDDPNTLPQLLSDPAFRKEISRRNTVDFIEKVIVRSAASVIQNEANFIIWLTSQAPDVAVVVIAEDKAEYEKVEEFKDTVHLKVCREDMTEDEVLKLQGELRLEDYQMLKLNNGQKTALLGFLNESQWKEGVRLNLIQDLLNKKIAEAVGV